jgi:hypothetical protein
MVPQPREVSADRPPAPGEPVSYATTNKPVRTGGYNEWRHKMTKVILVAMMALGLGMGAASAQTSSAHPNWPSVTHNGPPASGPSFAAGSNY